MDKSFMDVSCEKFTEALASKAPVPGGGGASSLVGAVGIALGAMVGSLTLGKKKYADVQEDIAALMEEAEALRAEFLRLADRDAEVFEPLSRAYGMPKDTEEQQAEKDRVMEAALKDACEVPLEVMEACGRAIEVVKGFADKGSVIAISDAGVAAASLRAAIQGASLNVFINTKAMKDRAAAEAANAKADALLAKYVPLADAVFEQVRARVR